MNSILKMKNFVVCGDTLNEEKYAYKIKQILIDNGYNVSCVGKELSSINDVQFEIDCLDLCIHPIKGIKLLEENKKNIKMVVIQPGAESPEIKNFLEVNNIPFIEDCLYRALK